MEEVTFNGLTWVRKQEYIDLSRRLTEAIAALNDEKAGRSLLAKATDRINELEADLAEHKKELVRINLGYKTLPENLENACEKKQSG